MFFWFNQDNRNFEWIKDHVNLVPEFLEVIRDESLGELVMRWIAAMYDSRSPYYHLEEKERYSKTIQDIFRRKTAPFDPLGKTVKAACDKYMSLYIDSELEQYRVYELTLNKLSTRMGQLNVDIPAERAEIESIAKTQSNLNKDKRLLHAAILERIKNGDLGKPNFTTKAGKALSFMEMVHGGMINPEEHFKPHQ